MMQLYLISCHLAQLLYVILIAGTCSKCFLKSYCYKPDFLVRLNLTNGIHIRTDHRADHGVTAAGYRVTVENNWFAATRNLNGADGITRINNIRWVICLLYTSDAADDLLCV